MKLLEVLHKEQLKLDKKQKDTVQNFIDDLLRDTNVVTESEQTVYSNQISSFAKPIFNAEVIKSVCVNFRLRFLRSGAYKGEYPAEAANLADVIAEDEANFTGRFYVMAPSHFFTLSGRRSSPILFAERNDGRFQVMYMWGSTVSWLRLLLNYPFRNFYSMVATSAIIGLSVVLLFFAMDWLSAENWLKNILIKIPIFVLVTGFSLVISVIYGLITYTDFSEEAWRSRRLKIKRDDEA
jgi:hypothetical protein